jgi:NADH-quinone oxidoreductase subunit G
MAGELAAGTIILLGERLATSPGALSAAARVAAQTGARLAWIPRRAGERGALDTGCLPTLLAGGRPVADPVARQQLCTAWKLSELPDRPGRDTAEILSAAAGGELEALVIGGIELGDLTDPHAALAAVEATGFVVSLELRQSEVTTLADVIFPVAPVTEKSGSFLDWEGRVRPFEAALVSNATSDLRVLTTLADALGVDLGFDTAEQARAEMATLGGWRGQRPAPPDVAARGERSLEPGEGDRSLEPGEGDRSLEPGEAVLAGWRMLLDCARLQDGEPHLAGTAQPPVARMSAATAAAVGAESGQPLRVSTGRGSITLPLVITEMRDQVVWLPLNSPGSAVHRALGVSTGAVVRIEAGALP